MARIRTIKPEFPHSESMGRISRDARLCFIQMWTIADDEGRLRGSSRMLASLLFPYDDDAPDLMETWLAELEREHCIVRYSVGGGSFIQITKWLEHQKIDKPSKSKIPEFAEASRTLSKPRELSSGDQDQGPRTKDQTPLPPLDGIDEIRKAVWRLVGLSEDEISTKLVSLNSEGIRQVRVWLESHPQQAVLDAIADAFDGADRRGEKIRNPWKYLDQVVAGIGEKQAAAASDGLPPVREDPWPRRMGLAAKGKWLETWGDLPGRPRCEAPADIQAAYLAAKGKPQSSTGDRS